MEKLVQKLEEILKEINKREDKSIFIINQLKYVITELKKTIV
jgi:hypothetical protein